MNGTLRTMHIYRLQLHVLTICFAIIIATPKLTVCVTVQVAKVIVSEFSVGFTLVGIVVVSRQLLFFNYAALIFPN